MIIPNKLQLSDSVAIVATARKVSPEEILPAVQLLKSWGLHPIIPDSLFDSSCQMAGSDEHRAQLLQNAINDPNVKAIWCARGGYGSVRIVDKVDFSPLMTTPKWIIGYSDVTVIHCELQRIGIASIHATMPINVPPDADKRAYPATETLHNTLFDPRPSYSFDSHPLNRKGAASGILVGGNLSILYSLCGSASQLNTRGKILFIEDLDEYLYHIDRMMINLKRCGMLDGVNGLVVGALSDMHDNAIPFGKTAEEIVLDTVRDYDFPVCFCAPFGHIGCQNKALILGKKINLEVNNRVSISSI